MYIELANMKKVEAVGLRKKLALFFFIVSMTAIAPAIYTAIAIGNPAAGEETKYRNPGFDQAAKAPGSVTIQEKLNRFRFRVILIAAGAILISLILFYMFFKKIVFPLDNIETVTRKKAGGRLDELIVLEEGGEFNKIGEQVNDLATNLQEILVNAWSLSGQALQTVDVLDEINEKENENEVLSSKIKIHLNRLRQNVNNLRELVEGFEFYDLSLEEDKILAEKPPEQKIRF
jgi:methyl-accepting chemotaxis protein